MRTAESTMSPPKAVHATVRCQRNGQGGPASTWEGDRPPPAEATRALYRLNRSRAVSSACQARSAGPGSSLSSLATVRSILRRLKSLRWRRALRTVQAAWSDVRDWVRGERDPLVPPTYRRYPGWRGDFGKASGRWVLAAFDVGELAPDGRVLDIGCGPGRIAARLTRQLEGGSYEGFDIVPRNIRWCQRKISPRHPSFRFQLADIRNAQYNPTGSHEARAYSFPYPDREFDLALAASVFTHLRPGEIERYVSRPPGC